MIDTLDLIILGIKYLNFEHLVKLGIKDIQRFINRQWSWL